jgi:putative sigma-54 modulation protein
MVNVRKFEEEEALGYSIDIIGRNIEVTEIMRSYIWNKISKIERFHNHIMYVHIALELQNLEHFCAIILKFNHFKIKVQSSSTDMYASIDESINRLQAVIARYKSRIQDHLKDGRLTLPPGDLHALGPDLALGQPDALRQLVEPRRDIFNVLPEH